MIMVLGLDQSGAWVVCYLVANVEHMAMYRGHHKPAIEGRVLQARHLCKGRLEHLGTRGSLEQVDKGRKGASLLEDIKGKIIAKDIAEALKLRLGIVILTEDIAEVELTASIPATSHVVVVGHL